MNTHRIPSLLQGFAEVRHWIVKHVPVTESLIGYDLFLKIGNDFFLGKEVNVKSVSGELPYSQTVIGHQISEFEDAGLLVRRDAGTDRSSIVPTPKLVSLLRAFHQKFETLFIPRSHLRARQLVISTENRALGQFVEVLYDRFFDLGWLYLHHYGSACFMMASLVKGVAQAHGHGARVEIGYVKMGPRESVFLLGGKGYAQPGQVDGHAVCIIDDAVLVDFGLGSARRFYRKDFPWAIAADYRPCDGTMATVTLLGRGAVVWKNDWRSPQAEHEVARSLPMVEKLLPEYLAYIA
jgi:hypothetical protein